MAPDGSLKIPGQAIEVAFGAVKGIEPSYQLGSRKISQSVQGRFRHFATFWVIETTREFPFSEWRLPPKRSFFGSAVPLGARLSLERGDSDPGLLAPRCASRAYRRIVIAVTVIAY
jgi:hypothetical protein